MHLTDFRIIPLRHPRGKPEDDDLGEFVQRALPPYPVIFAHLPRGVCANWKHYPVIFADLAHLLRTCLELLGKFCLLNREFVLEDFTVAKPAANHPRGRWSGNFSWPPFERGRVKR